MCLSLTMSLSLVGCSGKGTASAPKSAAPTGTLGDPASETIGGLSLGATPASVEKLLGAPATKSPPQEMGATGEFVSDWHWTTGETLSMAGSTADAAPTVGSITLEAPSKLTTSRGVGIGTSRAEVETIYKQLLGVGRQEGEPDTTSPEQLIIGSVYGGTFFQFTDGKVSRIFVGAGAE